MPTEKAPAALALVFVPIKPDGTLPRLPRGAEVVDPSLAKDVAYLIGYAEGSCGHIRLPPPRGEWGWVSTIEEPEPVVRANRVREGLRINLGVAAGGPAA